MSLIDRTDLPSARLNGAELGLGLGVGQRYTIVRCRSLARLTVQISPFAMLSLSDLQPASSSSPTCVQRLVVPADRDRSSLVRLCADARL